MPFGGTVTLSLGTFSALLEDVCRSVVRHGFRRIALSNSHGGNENALRTITDDLTVRLGVPIVQFSYPHAAQPAIATLLTTQTGVRHACEAETAMMMAVRPELVANDRIAMAKANKTPDAEDIVGPGVYGWRTLSAMAATGVVGNPEAATAEKGKKLLDAIAKVLAEKLTNQELWRMQWQADPP